MTETPQFVRWAIQHPCPLRDQRDWQDPQQTEKQLKPLRAYSEAVVQRRVFEGFCFDVAAESTSVPADDPHPAKGFRTDEVLAAYGGQAFVHSLCDPCPANAAATGGQPAVLAGCYGSYSWSPQSELYGAVESAIACRERESVWSDMFLATTPSWYGIWAQSPLDRRRCQILADVLSEVIARLPSVEPELQLLAGAVQIAARIDVPLHATLVPRGSADDVHWTVVSHCSRCAAEMTVHQRRCPVCGQFGRPNPPRKRHVRGSRPYRSLASQMDQDEWSDLLQRYAEYRRSLAP